MAGLFGCAYAFLVFVLSFNSSYESLLSSVRILYVVLALTTLFFSLSKGADAVVVFACINGPALLVWYAVIPDEFRYYVPLVIIAAVSAMAAVLGRHLSGRFRRRL